MKNKILLIFISLLTLTACNREKDLILPDAVVTILNYDGNPIIQEPKGEIPIDVTMQSLAGIDKLEVVVNGLAAETIEPENVFTFHHSFTYVVPDDAVTGTEIKIVFQMTDKQGRVTISQPVLIRIDQPYIIQDHTANGFDFQKVTGRINKDFTFTSDKNWLLDSIVSVDQGATLTIEEGTTVYFSTSADNSRTSLLSILRGGKISARGTRENPIVFTSVNTLQGNAERGDWGGVLIHGFAPTNAGGTVIDGGFRYGGTMNGDNSGALRFVRIEYSGKNGYHSLQLAGVGAGTTIEYIESYESYNNAFRLRGGRVSLRYIAGIEHGGYGIWADEGWQGSGQFWLFQTGIKATLLPVNYWNQARSIEIRNDNSFFDKEPRTTFRLSNITLIGNGFEDGIDNGTRRGIRVRTGATGFIYNTIVTEFPGDALRVEDLPIGNLGNSMIIDHIHSYHNLNNWAQEAKDFFFDSNNYNLKETPVPGIAKDKFDAITPSPYNPTEMGSWFSNAPYIGAVNPDDDWTKGGRWFRNQDGTIR